MSQRFKVPSCVDSDASSIALLSSVQSTGLELLFSHYLEMKLTNDFGLERQVGCLQFLSIIEVPPRKETPCSFQFYAGHILLTLGCTGELNAVSTNFIKSVLFSKFL